MNGFCFIPDKIKAFRPVFRVMRECFVQGEKLQKVACVHDVFAIARIRRPGLFPPVAFRLRVGPYFLFDDAFDGIVQNPRHDGFLFVIAANSQSGCGISCKRDVVACRKQSELTAADVPPFLFLFRRQRPHDMVQPTQGGLFVFRKRFHILCFGNG